MHGKQTQNTSSFNLRRLAWGLLCLTGIMLTACSGGPTATATTDISPVTTAALPHASTQNPPPGARLLTANTVAADALAAMLVGRLGSTSGILTASLVELENLDKSSSFGQTSSQQIGSRLSQHGFKVLESRLADELTLHKTNGEFMLTRESARLLSREHDAHAVMLGVYSETAHRVFVSVRVVRLYDNAVMAAYEYYLPKSDDVAAMLGPAGKNTESDATRAWQNFSKREQAYK
ncbi:MAG: hypothetical protein LBV80_11380 [Deltaproteobacteria bacterium]|jgi:TolB-like protein|nr:hypothetical protein [Deltaproteobacteria bacterium]